MKALYERAVMARLAVAEDPKASINIKDQASKEGLEGAHTLHRHERDDETEAMRKRRREEEASAGKE